MTEPRPHLRAIREEDEEPGYDALEKHAPERGFPWGAAVLALLLFGALAFLAYSRTELGQKIQTLESEIVTLNETVAAREATIEAQSQRIDDVRTRVRGLVDLLEQPLEPN